MIRRGRAAGVALACRLVAGGVLVPLAPEAVAQVSTNRSALDQLGPARAPAARPAHPANATAAHDRHAHPAPGAATRPAKGGAHPQAAPAAPARRIGRAPTMPAHAPPPPIIAPPAVRVDLHPPPLPPPLPIDPHAAGVATPIKGGTQITFGAGSAALNPATDGAVLAIAAAVKAAADSSVRIDAYAAGPPEDPSTPRRLSLSRALAVRAVLINAGVPSTRIYARALGAPAQPPLGALQPEPADRTDITVETRAEQDRAAAPAGPAGPIGPGASRL